MIIAIFKEHWISLAQFDYLIPNGAGRVFSFAPAKSAGLLSEESLVSPLLIVSQVSRDGSHERLRPFVAHFYNRTGIDHEGMWSYISSRSGIRGCADKSRFLVYCSA
jgi:hypothetical protein